MDMIYAMLIPADEVEAMRIIKLPAEEGQMAEAMRELLGGYLEVVSSPRPELSLYCNEEGRLVGLPANRRATHLWCYLWEQVMDQYLVGNVLVLGAVDDEGHQLGLDADLVKLLQEVEAYHGQD